MSKEQTTLLPCPFCGGEARFVEDHGRFDEPFGLIVDHAEDCFIGSRIMAEWEAITTAWNRRIPNPTAIGEVVEALRWYGHQFCELGASHECCGRMTDDDCSGCKARIALAKLEGRS